MHSITLESILFHNCYEFLTQFFKPCFDSLEFGNLRVIFMKIVGGKVQVRTLDLGEDFNIDSCDMTYTVPGHTRWRVGQRGDTRGCD